MEEQIGVVTLQGNPLTLIGKGPGVGEKAPDCELVGNDLSSVRLSEYFGKVCILTSLPSLNTPVCDTETRRFNQEAAAMGTEIVVLAISNDLPFAQKQWCGASGVDKVTTLSDHRAVEFGQAFGVLIKELRLLARAVFVVDREGFVRYREIVSEVAEEPDYAAALAAAKEFI